MSVERAERDKRQIVEQIEELERKLEKIVIYIEMARIYGGETNDSPVVNEPGGETITNRGGRPAGMSNSAAIIAASKDILRAHGQRIGSRALYPLLQKRGLTVGGKDPVNGLARILSQNDGFTADRRLGWGLPEWEANGTTENEIRLPTHPTAEQTEKLHALGWTDDDIRDANAVERTEAIQSRRSPPL